MKIYSWESDAIGNYTTGTISDHLIITGGE